MRGATVIGTARTLQKANEATKSVGGENIPMELELSDPRSIRSAVETVKKMDRKLDAIIANAGIMALSKLTLIEGYEAQFFTNHMGHFLLITGLLNQLSDKGRVVVLSSQLHQNAPPEGVDFDNLNGKKGYKPFTAYAQSKFANLLFAKELARRFKGSARTANAIHPGVIKTNLSRQLNPLMAVGLAIIGPIALKSVAEGAATETYVAVHPEVEGVSGEYFSDCNIAEPRADSKDPHRAKRLWQVSEEIARSL
jgi:WW domain-containing oxidoreductase